MPCSADISAIMTPEAFRQLVHTHAAMVRATACRVTLDASLAMDVAQETFLALACHHGEPIRCVGAWLHQAALRRAQMAARSESRRQSGEAAAAEHWMEQNQGAGTASWLDLDEALASLPDPQRVVLVEHYLEGRTQQEIARRTGQSQASVSRLLERGLALMLASLGERQPALSGAALAAVMATLKSESALPMQLAALSRLEVAEGMRGAFQAFFLPRTILSVLMNFKPALILLTALTTIKGTIIGSRLAVVPGDSGSLPKQAGPASVQTAAGTVTGRGSAATSASGLQARREALLKAPGSSRPELAAPSSDNLARLRRLSRPGEFKAFLLRTYNLRDPEKVAAEISLHLGLELTAADLKHCLQNPSMLEAGIFWIPRVPAACWLGWRCLRTGLLS